MSDEIAELELSLREYLPWTNGGRNWVRDEHYPSFRRLLYLMAEAQRPMTVRQAFYRAVVKGYVEKTEKAYDFVQRQLAEMRRGGELPYEWIVDATRRVRVPTSWGNLNEFVEDIPQLYHRDLLANHGWSIQLWLEKEALAGVIYPITEKWDVPLYCAKGYSSLTFLYEAGQALDAMNRPARIFHIGDYDPSGQDAIATIQRDLPSFAPNTSEQGLEFVIIAVTQEQIVELGLPTRPTKKGDPRAAYWGGGDQSVEADAIEPNVLREMVDRELGRQFPDGAIEANQRQEQLDRAVLRRILEQG